MSDTPTIVISTTIPTQQLIDMVHSFYDKELTITMTYMDGKTFLQINSLDESK